MLSPQAPASSPGTRQSRARPRISNQCRTRRKSLRSQLYRAARDLGNVEAGAKGPTAYGRRVVRRKAYRSTNRVLGRFLRGMGL